MRPSSYTKLDDKQKYFIIFKREEGLSYREISKLLNEKYELRISHSTVQHFLLKYERTGQIHDQPRSGRPKRLNEKNSQLMIGNVKANPFQTLSSIKNKMEEEIGKVNERTIRKELLAKGYKAYSVKRREISEINRNKRIKFAKEHLSWKFKNYLFVPKKNTMLGSSAQIRRSGDSPSRKSIYLSQSKSGTI